MATVPVLEDQLREPGEADPVQVMLDLAALRFIDCCGVGALLRANRRARGCGYLVMLRPVVTLRPGAPAYSACWSSLA